MTKSIVVVCDPSTTDPHPVYVLRPATNADHSVPKWDGANTGKLEDGFPIVTTIGATGADTNLPTEQAVREAIAAIPAPSFLVIQVFS